MSSDAQDRSSGSRWRAPVTGAVAGLAVAAAIVGPSALASNGGSAGPCRQARASVAHSAAAGSVPSQFFAAVAQLVQQGTITQAQARTLDADIQSGSIDSQQLVDQHVLTASQMEAVNQRLMRVKESLASQMQSSSSSAQAAGTKSGG